MIIDPLHQLRFRETDRLPIDSRPAPENAGITPLVRMLHLGNVRLKTEYPVLSALLSPWSYQESEASMRGTSNRLRGRR
jgi:hypothetical protein